ncbi:MAG TPA: RpiB/LacA/LacB family sugar-phosphate isomerase [Ktedonobacterales bacterium]|nr:RpiB/LacA/LacB family sugar-phosphate isomerase [Ktedonobacterales bacterium]
MRLIVGSDEHTHMTDTLIAELRKRGHEVELVGPLTDEALQWPEVGRAVGEAVAQGRAEQGIVCCWTGTGVSIAANKVPGIRAALCTDAETARGARRWNHANVLALSLRLTSEIIAREILDAWFSAPEEAGDDAACVARVESMQAQ